MRGRPLRRKKKLGTESESNIKGGQPTAFVFNEYRSRVRNEYIAAHRSCLTVVTASLMPSLHFVPTPNAAALLRTLCNTRDTFPRDQRKLECCPFPTSSRWTSTIMEVPSWQTHFQFYRLRLRCDLRLHRAEEYRSRFHQNSNNWVACAPIKTQ